MAFSLSNWFKSKPGSPEGEPEGQPSQAPAPTPPPAAAPPAVRSVMPKPQPPVERPGPNRPISLPTGVPPPVRSGPPAPPAGPARKITFPGMAQPAAISAPEPEYAAPAEPEYEPTPAAPEMTIHLELGDFLDRLPSNFLQPGNFDRHETVEFLASELYSDLTRGRATVPASVIYQKCPHIFARPVSETEDVEIHLPLHKLVAQLGAALHTRHDQVAEENVAEIETPFLQVAMEDNARLPKAPGTTVGATLRPAMGAHAAQAGSRPFPIPQPSIPANAAAIPVPRPPHRTGQISSITPIKPPPAEQPAVAAPTAQSAGPILAGKRPPSTVRASVAGGKIRLSGPAVSSRSFASPIAPPPATPDDGNAGGNGAGPRPGPMMPAPLAESPSHLVTKKTARIQIPPISLRPAGAAPPRSAAPPSAPTSTAPVHPIPTPAKPGPESLTSFRNAPTSPSAPPPVTFRSTPPPPTAKPVPANFAPATGRVAFPTPAFPAAPPRRPVNPGLTASSSAAAPAPSNSNQTIQLGLAAILRGLPSSALAIDPAAVSDDERISLPFHLVESQLSLGRVAVPQEVFLQALPVDRRNALAADADLPEVPIPLQEVFQNLPSNALNMRADQIVEEAGPAFPTPFSQKAEEDAQRLGAPSAPVSLKPEPMPAMPSLPTLPAPFVEEPAPTVELEPALSQDYAPLPTLPEPEPAAPIVEARADQPAEEETSPAPEAFVEEPAPTPEVHAEEPAPAPEFHEPESHPVEAHATPEPVEEHIQPPDEQGAVLEPASAPEPEPPVFGEMRDGPAPVVEPSEPATPITPPEEIFAEAPAPAAPPEEIFAEVPAPVVAEEKPSVPAAEETSVLPVLFTDEMPTAPAPSHGPVHAEDTALQTLFMTEDELDAKTVVKLVCGLPGIVACTVAFEDGLLLAGNFPAEGSEGFSAMAPSFFRRSSNFLSELALGPLQTVTLHTDQGPLSFFMHNDICVSVRQTGRGFLPGVREKLEVVTRELAKMYATAKPDSTPHA